MRADTRKAADIQSKTLPSDLLGAIELSPRATIAAPMPILHRAQLLLFLGKYVKFPAKLVSVCTLMGLTSEAMSSPFLKGRGRAAERLGSER